MVDPAELPSRIPKVEKTPEEKRKEFKVIKGGKKKGWGPGAKAGAIIGTSAAVVSGVTAALGETDNLPDPLQGFYNQAFHPGKVAEEVSDQAVRDKYDVEEASGDLTKITNETKAPEITAVPTTETTAEIVKVDAPEITGLKFDQATKTYLAEANNPYGLETGVEAGVYVKDAIEINRKMKDSIDLKQEVINFLQDKLFKETKDYFVIIPLSLKNSPGVKMNELEVDIGPAKGEKTLGIVAPKNSVFFAPFPGEWILIWDEDRLLSIFVDIGEPDRGAGGVIYFKEAEITQKVIRTDKAFNSKTNKEIKIEILDVKLGEPLGRIVGEATLDLLANRTNIYHFNTPGEYQLGFTAVGRDRSIGGIDRLMKLDKDCFISIFNETAHEQDN